MKVIGKNFLSYFNKHSYITSVRLKLSPLSKTVYIIPVEIDMKECNYETLMQLAQQRLVDFAKIKLRRLNRDFLERTAKNHTTIKFNMNQFAESIKEYDYSNDYGLKKFISALTGIDKKEISQDMLDTYRDMYEYYQDILIQLNLDDCRD